jgi:hypothetical protein
MIIEILITSPSSRQNLQTQRPASFLKILCNHVISGKLASAELIISVMTGLNAMPFAITICEIGNIAGNDLRMDLFKV